MTTLTFDTLKFVKTLESAGVPAPQAEAFSTAVRNAYDAVDVPTKGDLRELEHRIDTRFAKIDGKVESGFARVDGELKLVKWMLGASLAASMSLVLKAYF